ncbi:MAG TPA: glycosyltransferase family 2 protein [Chthoniobacterales bacterium]|nr:glycosyltransferase family 2 protein [Chthoniobacterales bacterium]
MTPTITGADLLKPKEGPNTGLAQTERARRKLSVVTSLYNSAPYLEEFYRRTLDQIRQLQVDYEFVLVDDGSPDHVLNVALGLMRCDPKLRVVELSRNFGHHKALMTGLEFARGDLVFLIDVDLEEPPEALAIFFQKMMETTADVVFGVQDRHSDPWFRRVTGRTYYWLYNLLAKNQMAPNQLTARLMRRPYVDALLLHREHLFAIEVLWQITGFVQIPCPINKTAYKGTSAYTFAKRLRLFVNAIAMSSRQPLVFIAYLGLFATFVCAAYIIFILIQYFFLGVSVSGWTSVIVSTWLLGGIIIFCLGIISIYLSIIFEEVKMRPYVIVKRVHEDKSAAVIDRELDIGH